MVLLVLEALGALALLLLIVWWTMFSGRDKGELPQVTDTAEVTAPVNPVAPSPSPETASQPPQAKP